MRRRLGTALAALVGALLFTATPALGAQTTKTLNFPLSGNSSTAIFDEPFACCDINFDVNVGVDTISVHDNIHGSLSLVMDTSMSTPSHDDLSFTDTNLRQGRTLDLTNTFTNDSGSFDVGYTLGYDLSLYGFHFGDSKSASDSLSCGLPLLSDTCSRTKNITLFSFTLIDLGFAWFDVNVLLPITTTADITGDGVTSHRTMTVAGADVVPPADLHFTASPQAKDESVKLSCSLPVNEPVNYAMGDPSSHVDGNVTEGVGIGVNGTVWVPNPLNPPDFKSDVYDTPPITIPDLLSLPPVTFNTIALSAPGQNVDLGNLLPNNIAPTVAMNTIPTDGVEGSPIQLSVKGTGPGGSMSPCGDESLDVHWSFDDGGSAYGKTIHHAWADNFLGDPSPPHTGQVVVTDPTGLQTTLNFAVPVANVSPSVDAGPSKSALWGVPVAFHGNGFDTGSVDNSILKYLWDFGDPSAPLGAAGQDVSHVYALPGSYTAQVTVTDNDDDQGTDTVAVTVLQRATTTSYTGPITSNSSKTVTLTASLVDELNQPVGGAAILFTLGTQSVSANTDGSGVASATLKLSQKHGTYTLAASFAGSTKYLTSSSSQTFTIGP